MQQDIVRAIARQVAENLILEWGGASDPDTINDYISENLPGLKPEVRSRLFSMIEAYVKTAEVVAFMNDNLVSDDGEILPEGDGRDS